MTDWKDNFEKLEQKLSRVVELFKQAQSERRALREEVERLNVDFKERAKRGDTLDRELEALRREREDVRSRIEKLLEQIDMLTKPDSAG